MSANPDSKTKPARSRIVVAGDEWPITLTFHPAELGPGRTRIADLPALEGYNHVSFYLYSLSHNLILLPRA